AWTRPAARSGHPWRRVRRPPAMPADAGPPVPPSPAGEAPPQPPVTIRPPPRASAVVVLVRGQGDGLEVFWALRSDAVSYMPGFRSFVGGTVDPEDAALPIDGTPAGP